MAWRIQDSVQRGEIDNRQKNVVRGRLWLEGLAAPVVLELTGNACADLAGCCLTFTNPQPTVPMRRDAVFSLIQRGQIGELTASRKVREYSVPWPEADAMLSRGEKPPEHLVNSVYLEWFSEANGRVVIESADYAIAISPPAWRLSAQDEEQRQTQAEAGWQGFMGKVNEALEQQTRNAPDPDKKWDEHDHERLFRECDARTDKYSELLDKYGHSPEAQDKIDELMGWNKELTEEEAAEQARRIEEINAACEEALNEPPPEPDPAREGIDWIRTKHGGIRHPLQHRCTEAAMKYWHQCKDLGLSKSTDDDLDRFLSEFQITGSKLAGALGSIADGGYRPEPSFTVAYLKRALSHLHESQAGLEALATKQPPLLPAAVVTEARRALFEIREGILGLMQELRNQG